MGSRFRWVEGCVRRPRDRRKQVDRGPERIRAGGAVGPVPSTHLWFVSSSQSEEAGRRKKRCWGEPQERSCSGQLALKLEGLAKSRGF